MENVGIMVIVKRTTFWKILARSAFLTKRVRGNLLEFVFGGGVVLVVVWVMLVVVMVFFVGQ
jgi:hypothetical protein